MKTILIVDVETTGLDPETDSVIELGYVLWSVEHRTTLEVYSALLPAAENPAEDVNGIPVAALRERRLVVSTGGAWQHFAGASARADALVAHQADFDFGFVSRLHDPKKVWICTREDMRWPRASTGTSLIATALEHGVAVTDAHRAISDCLLLARLFDRCFEAYPDMGERLEAAFEHAQLPKVRLVSLAPFEEKDTVKAHGFKWDPKRREWWRVMCVEDAAELPFETRAS